MCDDFRVLTITHPDVENGLGCRVTIWTAGCSHHCPECHNKHTWDYNQGSLITSQKVHNVIYQCVSPKYIKGITLSGGDPLDQSDSALQQLYDFLQQFKHDFPEKDIWFYCGDTFETLCENPIKKNILQLGDVLVDGPFVKKLYDPDIAFRGSTNQRIIDLKQTFKTNSIVELNLD